jgi:hypothetical protein
VLREGNQADRPGVGQHELGNDGGNAIYFYTDDMVLRRIDDRYNMNDAQGAFMFKLLGMAISGGNTVIGYDNWDGQCDKVNQLTFIGF